MRRFIRAALILTPLAIVAVSLAATQGEGEPRVVVERLHDALIDVMKQGDAMDYAGRYDQLAPVVHDVDDLPFIARLVMGKRWGELSEAQQATFLDAFAELSVATYAARFNSFSGQRFEIRKVTELPRGGVQVRSVLVRQDGREVHLDYLLHQRDQEWRIVNILAEGVSDVAVKRSEYETLMKKEGFDGLITKLNEKITSLRHRGEDETSVGPQDRP